MFLFLIFLAGLFNCRSVLCKYTENLGFWAEIFKFIVFLIDEYAFDSCFCTFLVAPDEFIWE